MSDNKSELDPQIAHLIGLTENIEADSEDKSNNFKIIKNIYGKPLPCFNDKDFYKKALSNEGEPAKRFLELLSKFLNSSIPADKSIFRGRLIPAFWDLLSLIAGKVSKNLPIYKIVLLRFGMVSPAFLLPEQRNMLSRVILKNETGEPVYYTDEWLNRIAGGLEIPSATDELKPAKKDSSRKLIEKKDKTLGHRNAELSLLRNKTTLRNSLEIRLNELVRGICDHSLSLEVDGMKGPYSEVQKKQFHQLGDVLRQLMANDKEITGSFAALKNLNKSLDKLIERTGGLSDEVEVDTSVVIGEFNSLRQMAKLCVGRKGNHLPVLMKNYIRSNFKEFGIRENIINEMAHVESIDPSLFFRTFKNRTTRIVPNVLLLPNYGEYGICWEPFERRNKAGSRGRIAIPMYPKNLRTAVISALADLRWQVAKEKAQHYWMEEGITGRYYQWFRNKKLRGDVRASFINNYILWITKERLGTQKLDREVRGIFWRNMPFPREIKDDLKNRGYVYNELYKKDVNRSMSDGY